MNVGRNIHYLTNALAIATAASPLWAVTHLKRQMEAPAFALTDLDGAKVTSADLSGKISVVIFGELYHEKTLQACAQVRQILDDKRFAGKGIVALLIVAQDKDPQQLKAQAAELQGLPAIILHDRQRTTYEAYQVSVLPSVVVVDEKGRVIHALASLTGRFADIVTDTLLFAVGEIDAQQFEQALNPKQVQAPGETEVRANRITQLAKQLARRGLSELAEEKYREALAVSPDYTPAHLGLGILQLNRQHLAEAETHFTRILALEPDSTEAALGLAFVQTQRGADELDSAQVLVARVLEADPMHARAYYLQGMIYEKRDDYEKAAASFKQAAELLMERMAPEVSP